MSLDFRLFFKGASRFLLRAVAFFHGEASVSPFNLFFTIQTALHASLASLQKASS
jgi:hypothetical protein